MGVQTLGGPERKRIVDTRGFWVQRIANVLGQPSMQTIPTPFENIGVDAQDRFTCKPTYPICFSMGLSR